MKLINGNNKDNKDPNFITAHESFLTDWYCGYKPTANIYGNLRNPCQNCKYQLINDKQHAIDLKLAAL